MPTSVYTHQHRVEFHETDMAGIVHFSNFFRYMESAEHAFLRSLGHPIHQTNSSGEMGWPRVHTSCDYRKPARCGDLLDIHLYLAEVGNRSLTWKFQIQNGDLLLAEGVITAACVTLDKKTKSIQATPIPEKLKEQLNSLSN